MQTVKDDGKIPGDWDRQLLWLNDVLSEVWRNRGPFPGIGSVLQYLGFEAGTAFQREVLVPLLDRRRKTPREYTRAIPGKVAAQANRRDMQTYHLRRPVSVGLPMVASDEVCFPCLFAWS